VKNPTSCKTDCPACARVCPETAIIFPKYSAPPINGGEAKEIDGLAEPVKVDIEKLVSGDVLEALRDRGKGGFHFSREPGRFKAIQERMVQLTGSQRPFHVSLDALTPRPQGKKESK
jgi:ferredoxin